MEQPVITVCNYVDVIGSYCYTYSALQKYWKSKDKVALLAVESRHLQI